MDISYSTLIYEGKELPQAVAHIKNAGYNGIELNPKDWEWALEKGSIDELKQLFIKNKIKVSGVMGGFLTREEDLHNFNNAADIGSALGSDIVFFVSPDKKRGNFDTFCSLVKKACRSLKDKNMMAVLHHHAGTIVETLQQTVEGIKSIDEPNFGLCFDTVHYAIFEDDIIGCVSKLKDHIKYVHLKDIKKDKHELFKNVPVSMTTLDNLKHVSSEYTGLGEGVIDNKRIIQALIDIGYSGWWVIEVERQEYDRQQHAINNMKVLNEYLNS
jgi:sugar phosphate isomerase/epimerase